MDDTATPPEGSPRDGSPGAGSPSDGPGERRHSERVKAARVARHRRWADLQVEEAMRRGDFDGLPSAGKPLDLGDRHDPNWWVKRLIQREQIEGTTPPAIALRLEDGRLDDDLDHETTEREVRRRVQDFNRRVREARRQLTGGPPVITPLRDEDVEVQRWRERRETRRAVAAADRAAAQARAAAERADRRQQGWRSRWRRTRSAAVDGEAGAVSATAVGVLGVSLAAAVATGVWLTGGSDDDPAALPSTRAPSSGQVTTAEPTPDAAATPLPAARPDDAADAASTTSACEQPSRAFRPTSVVIPGVQRRIEVVYPRRDENGIPGTPPLTTDGKAQMAFDTANGIAPGAEEGNALFNAHSWPDGSALGNRLLREFTEGDLLRVRGKDGREACYRLARRVEVPATVSGAQYYRRDGAPRLAIVVCSGDRSATGAWSHRTLFFAAPVDSDA